MSTDKRSLADEWASFFEQVVPPGAGPVQVMETRGAFYAGAVSLWGIVMDVLEPGQEPTAADLRAIVEVHREMNEYLHELKAQAKE